MDEILDEQEVQPSANTELKEIIKWWEKKRLPFNVIIITVSILWVFTFQMMNYTVKDMTRLIFWFAVLFLAANICYTFSWFFEVLNVVSWNKGIPFKKYRIPLFWLGVLFSLWIISSCTIQIIKENATFSLQ